MPGILLKVPEDWELAKKYPFFPEFLEQEKEIPKLILVVIQEQFLAGYEFGQLKFWYPVCSGKEKGLTPEWFLKTEGEWPTPRGRFPVLYKDQYHKSNLYPEPGGGWPMLYALMFSWQGYGLHAYSIPESLREHFGLLPEDLQAEVKRSSRMPGWPASHGCVRLFIEDARNLFKWAKIGTIVLIIDSFDDLEKIKAPSKVEGLFNLILHQQFPDDRLESLLRSWVFCLQAGRLLKLRLHFRLERINFYSYPKTLHRFYDRFFYFQLRLPIFLILNCNF